MYDDMMTGERFKTTTFVALLGLSRRALMVDGVSAV